MTPLLRLALRSLANRRFTVELTVCAIALSVFVLSEWGAKINGLFDIVSVTGILRARTSDSPYGAAGYTLEAEKVEPYVYEEG